jgi:glycosyltransferase involved in cell wall biosynthesis
MPNLEIRQRTVVSEVARRPELLYVSPVVPGMTGNGLAMRAGMVLEALSGLYRISLLVVPCYPTIDQEIPDQLLKFCDRTAIVPHDNDMQRRVADAGRAFHDLTFDTVHAFRLATLPFARPYFDRAGGRTHFHLDLDDIESKTHRRIANLHENAGNVAEAESEKAWSRRSLLLETAAFQIFHRIYVCSEADKQELLQRGRAEVQVLKNAVRLPAKVGPRSFRSGEVFRLLFVGTLGYYPNQDAMQYFCEKILPILRGRSEKSFRVDIVGAYPPESLRRLTSREVCVIGTVRDVPPWYEECHAVIVPIRAGGGSRIKILEAFSYQRPVITTSVGIEGIEAESNRHALIEDTAEGFAEACIRLMSDSECAKYLVENSADLLTRSYTGEALRRQIAALG